MATHDGEYRTKSERLVTYTSATPDADSEFSSEWSIHLTPPASDSGSEDQSPSTTEARTLSCSGSVERHKLNIGGSFRSLATDLVVFIPRGILPKRNVHAPPRLCFTSITCQQHTCRDARTMEMSGWITSGLRGFSFSV